MNPGQMPLQRRQSSQRAGTQPDRRRDLDGFDNPTHEDVQQATGKYKVSAALHSGAVPGRHMTGHLSRVAIVPRDMMQVASWAREEQEQVFRDRAKPLDDDAQAATNDVSVFHKNIKQLRHTEEENRREFFLRISCGFRAGLLA